MDTLEEILKPVFSQQRDRCDRCGAAASVRATKHRGTELSELLFCGHHGDEHQQALQKQGWSVAR